MYLNQRRSQPDRLRPQEQYASDTTGNQDAVGGLELAQQLTMARVRPRTLNAAYITQVKTRLRRESRSPLSLNHTSHTTLDIRILPPRSTPSRSLN